MAKIRIREAKDARPAEPLSVTPAEGLSIDALLDAASDPLHLHRLTFAAGATATLNAAHTDLVAYVWQGTVKARGATLEPGSSLTLERGTTLDMVAEGAAIVFLFNPREAIADRAGGHVHILPNAHVPRLEDLGTQNMMGGGIHIDAQCPTCAMWLHENDFHNPAGTVIPIHSHSEDEIIVVTRGALRVGARHLGPGSALAVAADTKYGFDAEPEGLSFINFRATSPTATLSDGVTQMDEAHFWTSKLGRPVYLAV